MEDETPARSKPGAIGGIRARPQRELKETANDIGPTAAGIVVRFLMRAAVVMVVLYLCICTYLYFDQRNLIYHPEGAPTADHTDFEVTSGGTHLKGWVLNASNAKALLYFGGNGEDVGAERQDLARIFANRAVFILPYRGYGPNPGSPTEQSNFADALALYDTVHARHPIVAVVGRSLGTGVASYLASRRTVERLALVTPFDTLASAAQARYGFVPVGLMLKDRYESARYVRDYTGPVLILRGGRDSVVPAASTARLIAAFRVRPKVVDFPAAGHNSISRDPGYAEALSQFMR